MPEGDAVVRTARRLDRALAGRRLRRAELRWPNVAGVDLAGVSVIGTATYGKHLLTRLDDGRTLHTHLRMDGSWRTRARAEGGRPERFGPDVRAVLSNAEWTAVGRRLGMLDLLRTADEARLIGHLGPDVLAPELDRERAAANLAAQGSRGIGESLLDQRVLAGIGTIWMAETLFAHRIWPWAPVSTVPDVGALVDTARALMQRSLAAPLPRGAAPEQPGVAVNVHGREGRSCPRCGTPIERGEVGTPPTARPVFYCPRCQREGRG